MPDTAISTTYLAGAAVVNPSKQPKLAAKSTCAKVKAEHIPAECNAVIFSKKSRPNRTMANVLELYQW